MTDYRNKVSDQVPNHNVLILNQLHQTDPARLHQQNQLYRLILFTAFYISVTFYTKNRTAAVSSKCVRNTWVIAKNTWLVSLSAFEECSLCNQITWSLNITVLYSVTIKLNTAAVRYCQNANSALVHITINPNTRSSITLFTNLQTLSTI